MPEFERDATGLSRGVSRLLIIMQEITPPGCHGLAPWSFTFAANIASNVRLHGTSPWHLGLWGWAFVSSDRETPRDKPVAS